MRWWVSHTRRRAAGLLLLALLVAVCWSSVLRAAKQRVADCHRLGNDGFAVGPDLSGARSGGKEKLLVNILDPNREIPPNYFGYIVETREGDSYAGLIVNETANSVTVRPPLGTEVVVPRLRIANMQASRLSLMPEGLEEGLSEQDLADLVDFIFADSH